MRAAAKRADEAATAPPPARARARHPQILLFGDSHSHAVQRAVDKRIGKGLPAPLTVYRVQKEKNGRTIGNISLDGFLNRIGTLQAEDVVLSMIGGNQHAVFSTIQHAQAFDFVLPGADATLRPGTEVIPYRVLNDLFSSGLSKGDCKSLKMIRGATRARVIHIMPPPPKRDNDFIQRHHESTFAEQGIGSQGVSDPELRLKFWLLQAQILRKLCGKIDVEILMPPPRAVEDGFLRPEFYADDATHANWRYGERVIRQVESRYVEAAEKPE